MPAPLSGRLCAGTITVVSFKRADWTLVCPVGDAQQRLGYLVQRLRVNISPQSDDRAHLHGQETPPQSLHAWRERWLQSAWARRFSHRLAGPRFVPRRSLPLPRSGSLCPEGAPPRREAAPLAATRLPASLRGEPFPQSVNIAFLSSHRVNRRRQLASKVARRRLRRLQLPAGVARSESAFDSTM